MIDASPAQPMIWGRHRLDWDTHTHIMGIINVTPDSFSADGIATEGRSRDEVIAAAVAQARQMVADGAALLDVGGESTRPATEGQPPLSAEVERDRVVPVIRAIAAAVPPEVIISVDTSKAGVAQAALDAGASMVNDIYALRADPALGRLVAERGVPVVLMSNVRGQRRLDPVSDVIRQLALALERAFDAGIAWERIILDPGFGFGLAGAENFPVLAHLADLRALGRPLLVGTSRKSHIGLVLGTPPEDRLEGTAATTTLAIAGGAAIVRVHDVRQMARVARMTDAIVRGWRETAS